MVSAPWCSKEVRKRIAVCATSTTPLRELTCHMESHSVTCHPAKVTFPPLPQPIKAGTRYSDPRGMQGWVDLVGLVTYQGGIPAQRRSRIPILTGLNVMQLRSYDERRYHSAEPPTKMCICCMLMSALRDETLWIRTVKAYCWWTPECVTDMEIWSEILHSAFVYVVKHLPLFGIMSVAVLAAIVWWANSMWLCWVNRALTYGTDCKRETSSCLWGRNEQLLLSLLLQTLIFKVALSR